jgi:hypothetical protein
MAETITPDADAAHYHGLPSVFGYTNDDGRLVRWNCGQAAAATFLTCYGVFAPDPGRAAATMAALESVHPPDQLAGYFGTGRRRVERICRAYGVELDEVVGEAALRAALDRSRPVIIMLGVPAGRFLGVDLPGGHWVVAYGYDDGNVYLSNWGQMTWPEFNTGWDGFVPGLIRMRGRGLVARE